VLIHIQPFYGDDGKQEKKIIKAQYFLEQALQGVFKHCNFKL
jgi:hypothetical protein